MVRKDMAPAWLRHHDHRAEMQDYKGKTPCSVALGLWHRCDSRPVSKGVTSKTEAQL